MNQDIKDINWTYFNGVVEADGTILVFFRPDGRVAVEIRFAQSSNRNLLGLVDQFLQDNKFTTQIDKEYPTTSLKRGRAPTTRVQGNDKVRNLLHEMTSNKNQDFVFAGVKARDKIIVDILLNRKNLNIAQKIALKKSMHKQNQYDPDHVDKQTISRAELERRFGLQADQSYIEGESILAEVDQLYQDHQVEIVSRIVCDNLNVSPDWVAGIVDTDGYFGVSMQRRENHVEWGSVLELSTNKESSLTNAVVLYAIKSKVKGTGGLSVQESFEGFQQVLLRNTKEMKFAIEYIKPYLRGELRIQQLQTVEHMFSLKERDLLKSLYHVRPLLQEIYHVSSLTKKGRQRKFSYEEMVSFFEERYLD